MKQTFRNIGPQTQPWLEEISVHTQVDLAALGSVFAWKLIKQRHPEATRVLLYALEGALRDCHWQALPAHIKAQLNAAADAPMDMSYPRTSDSD